MKKYRRLVLVNMKIILIVLFVINLVPSRAQVGQWAWIKGSSTANSPGNYGIKGVPSSTNEPPAVYEACEWKDINGNFWFYGGAEHYASSSYPTSNDLWKYNPTTNEWTWISGTHTTNDPGSYGIKGVQSPTNRPPSMGWGILSWTDLAGDLWMYGGYTANGEMSDLWRYNIASNQWTWMKGPGTSGGSGTFGIRTVPDTANNPPALSENAVSWTDLNGDLWYFGGGVYNTLWRYHIATNTWTWMKGSNGWANSGIWGTMGIEDTANVPNSRSCYSHWIDNSGNLWMFGGIGGDANGNTGPMQDMWKYNPSTNSWTWMNGSKFTNSIGHYGTLCVADSLNQPLGRVETRAVWKDMQGNFWLFGGMSNSGSFNGFNDLWKYCVASNKWACINGANLTNSMGNYGSIGVASSTNQPPSRIGALGWSDDNGHLYLYGGLNYYASVLDFNDLWKFTIDTSCAPCYAAGPPPQPAFVASDSAFCSGNCVNFTNHSVNASSYQWSFPGGIPSSDTTANPPSVCYLTPGNYNVSLTAQNINGSSVVTATNIITVYPPVQFNPIVQNGDTLFSVQGYSNYQWYLDTSLIAGATNFFYVASQNGDYSVQVTDSNGCSAVATKIGVITDVNESTLNETDFVVRYFTGNIYVSVQLRKSSTVNIELFSSTGAMIYSDRKMFNVGKNEIEINNLFLAHGIYLVKIFDGNQSVVKKIRIQ